MPALDLRQTSTAVGFCSGDPCQRRPRALRSKDVPDADMLRTLGRSEETTEDSYPREPTVSAPREPSEASDQRPAPPCRPGRCDPSRRMPVTPLNGVQPQPQPALAGVAAVASAASRLLKGTMSRSGLGARLNRGASQSARYLPQGPCEEQRATVPNPGNPSESHSPVRCPNSGCSEGP